MRFDCAKEPHQKGSMTRLLCTVKSWLHPAQIYLSLLPAENHRRVIRGDCATRRSDFDRGVVELAQVDRHVELHRGSCWSRAGRAGRAGSRGDELAQVERQVEVQREAVQVGCRLIDPEVQRGVERHTAGEQRIDRLLIRTAQSIEQP